MALKAIVMNVFEKHVPLICNARILLSISWKSVGRYYLSTCTYLFLTVAGFRVEVENLIRFICSRVVIFGLTFNIVGGDLCRCVDMSKWTLLRVYMKGLLLHHLWARIVRAISETLHFKVGYIISIKTIAEI